MNTKDFLIIAVFAIGGYWLWQRYENPTTSGDNSLSSDLNNLGTNLQSALGSLGSGSTSTAPGTPANNSGNTNPTSVSTNSGTPTSDTDSTDDDDDGGLGDAADFDSGDN